VIHPYSIYNITIVVAVVIIITIITFQTTRLLTIKKKCNFCLVTETPDHVYVNSACSACRWESDTRAATVSDPCSRISSGRGDVTSAVTSRVLAYHKLRMQSIFDIYMSNLFLESSMRLSDQCHVIHDTHISTGCGVMSPVLTYQVT